MSDVLAARIRSHGDPAAVLELARLPVPVPGPGQVRLRMRLAPVNPADINVIEGSYGSLPTLPATPGNEGLGEVVALGEGVSSLAVGDLVRPQDGGGAWAQAMIADAAKCLRLPTGLPDAQAAMLTVNPATAWCVLNTFTALKPGDAVLVNGPTSGVGAAFLALAVARGLRVGCLVRRLEDAPALRAAGAAAVEVEGREAAERFTSLLGPARLALNMVGGPSAATLVRALGMQGHMITIGAMARQPLTLPNGALIFKELHLAGFWITRWYERSTPAAIAAMLEECAVLIRSGALAQAVAATYPLARVVEAVAHARKSGRGGKVMLDLG